jgi:hypothetical protein
VEFLMKSRFLHTRSAGAAILVLLTAATAASAFISPLRQPPIYTIQGYLDRAPAGTTVIDRIQVAATGRPPRWLLVTVYRSPGDLPPSRYLSRELMSPYLVSGKNEDVARLIGAPEGTEIKGTFVVYTTGPPWLLIAQLDLPT